MKKINGMALLIFILAACTFTTISAQCVNAYNLGSSGNVLTEIKNNGNTVVADKELNTVVFIHRNNAGAFGGSSGHLRYDVSLNGGATWVNNQGVLNPILTKQARYPNVAIYNPPGNTNPSNAYLTYLAPTINTSGGWSGVVGGVKQLSGSGNTEAYVQPGPTNAVVASLVKGAPGTFWATDLTYNGSQFTGGIMIYKGQWNGSTINWSLNQQFNPSYNLSSTGSPKLGEANIAFDPSGMKGWMCVTAHLSSASSYYRYLPVFYKTTNGGITWSGPEVFDLSQYSCITANVGFGSTPGIFYANDLTVDVYGNPHLLVTVGVGNGAYGIYDNQWHHVFDITQKHGAWTAYDLANVNAEIGTVYPGSNGSYVYQTMHPQVSRSADGTKVFFSWTDNSLYALGNPNMSPDLFARGLDVVQNKWTPVRDFTSCNIATSGWISFPHMAAETLEPQAGTYKLAVVYSFMTNDDPDDIATFRFLDNATFSIQDFSISQPVLNPLSVSPGSVVPICQGNFANLQVNGSFQQVAWSNGVTGPSNPVNTPGLYYVGVRQGCVVGWDSITVAILSMNLPAGNVNGCEGIQQNLNVNGNALSYNWEPGSLSGSSVIVSPLSSTIYTITASGAGGCTVTNTLSLTMNPAPIVTASSNHNLVCSGEEVILQAGGAATFSWSSGAVTNTTAVSPLSTTIYTVTGYSSVGCAGTFALTQVVDACTGVREAGTAGNQLFVYPNPAVNKINIQSSVEMQCTLNNEMGQVIRVLEFTSVNNRLVILDGLAPGIYFLSGRNGELTFRQKLIVQ